MTARNAARVTDNDRLAVLNELDDVWRYYNEIESPFGNRRHLKRTLQSARALGLVTSRRHDVSGRAEWATTEQGDALKDAQR